MVESILYQSQICESYIESSYFFSSLNNNNNKKRLFILLLLVQGKKSWGTGWKKARGEKEKEV